jgi:ribosomal protein S2
LDNYQQKRTKANRICRRKKKERLDNKIKEINKINRNRDTRKFYKDIRNLSNQPSVMTLVCKNKDGNILSERKQILERWQNTSKNY